MKLLANREIRRFFLALSSVLIGFALLSGILLRSSCGQSIRWLLYALMAGSILLIGVLYFRRQHAQLETAVSAINAYLGGDVSARIECDEEGELCRLFHAVNAMAAVLNAHADNEKREKEFLKNTMRAVGMDIRQLTRMIAAQALTYALSGCLAGCAAGIPLHRFLYHKMISDYWGELWHLPVMPLAVVLVLVLMTAVLAVMAPARRICNTPVTATINEL